MNIDLLRYLIGLLGGHINVTAPNWITVEIGTTRVECMSDGDVVHIKAVGEMRTVVETLIRMQTSQEPRK